MQHDKNDQKTNVTRGKVFIIIKILTGGKLCDSGQKLVTGGKEGYEKLKAPAMPRARSQREK